MKRGLVLGALLVTAAGFIVGARMFRPMNVEHASAIERCRAAIDGFQTWDAGATDIWPIWPVFLRECAAMVRDEPCKNAMERAAGSSGIESFGIALAGCRAKYCTPPAGVELCA